MADRISVLEQKLEALQNLVATLQEGWIRVNNPMGGTLYVNTGTGQAQFEPPLQLRGPPNFAQLQQTVQRLEQAVGQQGQRLDVQQTPQVWISQWFTFQHNNTKDILTIPPNLHGFTKVIFAGVAIRSRTQQPQNNYFSVSNFNSLMDGSYKVASSSVFVNTQTNEVKFVCNTRTPGSGTCAIGTETGEYINFQDIEVQFVIWGFRL